MLLVTAAVLRRSLHGLHARVCELGRTALVPAECDVRLQTGLHTGTLIIQRLGEGPRRYGIAGTAAQVAAQLSGLAGIHERVQFGRLAATGHTSSELLGERIGGSVRT